MGQIGHGVPKDAQRLKEKLEGDSELSGTSKKEAPQESEHAISGGPESRKKRSEAKKEKWNEQERG